MNAFFGTAGDCVGDARARDMVGAQSKGKSSNKAQRCVRTQNQALVLVPAAGIFRLPSSRVQ
jgi:hypothetical protein